MNDTILRDIFHQNSEEKQINNLNLLIEKCRDLDRQANLIALLMLLSIFLLDDIFNNRSSFEAAIVVEANKRVGKWFTISQLRTNIQPPPSIVESIKAKAKAVQDAITSESQSKAATADAQRKIALAKGDSATVVIQASSEAAALKLKQRELTPLYVEYIKASKWNGELPTTTLGNATPMLNLK